MLFKRLLLNSLMLFCLLLVSHNGRAECKGSIINPITDIEWKSVFPIGIGGITLIGTDIPTRPDPMTSPVCVCGLKFGIAASFWEPARIVETVKDAYCFPTINTQLSNPSQGFLSGGNKIRQAGDDTTANAFQQVHWYIFPVWGVLDLFTDMSCLSETGFDMAYLSEVDPTHNNCLLSFILNPEALLFGNPVAQVSCIADSVASNATYPLDPLFWCAGSFGSLYPLCGGVSGDDYSAANALEAARMIFKLGRVAALWDPGISYCGSVPTPIWVKSNYRLQPFRPTVSSWVLPIGFTNLVWDHGLNPPYNAGGHSADQWAYIVTRRHLCCVTFY